VRRRRSRFKLVLAAMLVLGGAGGAWFYLSNTRVTSSAGAAIAPATTDAAAAAEDGGAASDRRAADPSALTASPDPSYGENPPQRQKPPAQAHSDDPPVNIEGARPEAEIPPATPAAGDSTSPLEPGSSPELPSVNVDKITSAIGDNARAKADSLGRRTVTVKTPDFGKPDKP
jgi:hypothetical protein